MKLVADENFPPSLISALQKKRHDVKRIQRAARGISDTSIRKLAKRENRIVITFDRDFLMKMPPEERVSTMLFYFPQMSPDEILPYLDRATKDMKRLKKKKETFTAIYSEKGLEIIQIEDSQ